MTLVLILIFQNDFSQKVDDLARKALPKDGPGATIAVLRNGKVLHRGAYGLADLKEKTSLKPDSVFDLASVSKQFTAMAILILAERGKLSLEDDARKFLKELPERDRPIRIADLLHMVSGLADYMEFFDDLTKISNEDVARRVAKEKLVFATGTRHEYSNTDYILLGLIVARASGKNYGEFLTAEIFKPLVMKNAQVLEGDANIRLRATGYARERGGWRIDRQDTPGLVGDGGVYSTIEDLALWDRGLRENALVKAGTIAKAFTSGKLDSGKETGYGFGWSVEKDQVWHNGGWAGASTHISRNLKSGLTVIVLSNIADFDVDGLAEKIGKIFE